MEEPRVANPERNGIWVNRTEHSRRTGRQMKLHTERTTMRARGASQLDPLEMGRDPSERAPRIEHGMSKSVHRRSGVDLHSLQTDHGHGKQRARKRQQQGDRARTCSEERREFFFFTHV